MPVKHIDDETWRLIEKLNVKAVIATQKPIKEGQLIKFLLRRGLKDIKEEELKEIIKK